MEYQGLIEPLAAAFPHIDKLVGMLPELATLSEGRRLFRLMKPDEILRVRRELGALSEIHDKLLFLFANDAGDYFGFWLEGLAYSWAWYRHDEFDLVPVIRDTRRLKSALSLSVGDAGLPARVHDYPDVEGKASEDDIARDRQLVDFFREEFDRAPVVGADPNAWFNVNVVLAMTPKADVDTLTRFLDVDDDHVREAAIVVLGRYRHEPARPRIAAIAMTGSGNSQLAAKAAIRDWET